MQFNRDATGTMTPLPSPSIDTGMGFERITTILQGKTATTIPICFSRSWRRFRAIANTEYGADPNDDVSMRIIADHARAATFVIADGQYPGNDKRGYVLRKIMRRAMVHGKKLNIDEPFLYRIAGTVVEIMKERLSRACRRPRDRGPRHQAGRGVFRRHARTGTQGFQRPGAQARSLRDPSCCRGRTPFSFTTPAACHSKSSKTSPRNAACRSMRQDLSAPWKQRERSRQDYQAGKIREQVAARCFRERPPSSAMTSRARRLAGPGNPG